MAKQAAKVFLKMGPVKQALLRATAGQCGRDRAQCSRNTVDEVAKMDRPLSLAHLDSSEAMLYFAATLHRFGLPFDYSRLSKMSLPEICPCCAVPLGEQSDGVSVANRIFAWESHLDICGGGGRKMNAGA